MTSEPYASKKTISVDFDHTITVTENEYEYGDERPNPEVIEWMRDRYYEGHTLLVWTARPWTEAHIVAARLTEWDVRFHGLMMGKGGSDVYLDDKAVNVNADGWQADVSGILARQPWPPSNTGEIPAEAPEVPADD